MADNEAVITVRAEIADAIRNLQSLDDKLKGIEGSGAGAGAGLKRTEEEARAVETSSQKAANALQSIRGAILAIEGAIAAAGIARAFNAIVDATAESEEATARLGAVLKSTGKESEISADSVQALSEELSKLTGVEDDTITKAQSVLLAFDNIGARVLPAATRAALDLSAKLGTDLSGAAQSLGIALQSPKDGLDRLARSGVKFTEAQKGVIVALQESGDLAGSQTALLEELEKRVGGTAEALRNTLGGALSAVKVQAGELLEAIGKGGLAGGVHDLADALNDLAKDEGVVHTLSAIGKVLGAVVHSVVAFGETLKAEASLGSAAFDLLTERAGQFAVFLSNVLGSLPGVIKGLIPGLDEFQKGLANIGAAAEKAGMEQLRKDLGEAATAFVAAGGQAIKVYDGLTSLDEKTKETAKSTSALADANNALAPSLEAVTSSIVDQTKALQDQVDLRQKALDQAQSAEDKLRGANGDGPNEKEAAGLQKRIQELKNLQDESGLTAEQLAELFKAEDDLSDVSAKLGTTWRGLASVGKDLSVFAHSANEEQSALAEAVSRTNDASHELEQAKARLAERAAQEQQQNDQTNESYSKTVLVWKTLADGTRILTNTYEEAGKAVADFSKVQGDASSTAKEVSATTQQATKDQIAWNEAAANGVKIGTELVGVLKDIAATAAL